MIYKLFYNEMQDDFIEIPPIEFKYLILPCMASEFQKISTKPVTVTASNTDGGPVFPDFLYDNNVPLFSEKLFREMKKAGTSHLLCVPVNVRDTLQNVTVPYVLGLPPRINVTDDYGNIDERKAGNYSIFKSSIALDNTIYITQPMYDILIAYNPKGLEIFENEVL